MTDFSRADESMFWKIGPRGDGSVYMVNAANGTDWRLELRLPVEEVLVMSSNIKGSQPGQGFFFNELDPIDDDRFSSVAVGFGFRL